MKILLISPPMCVNDTPKFVSFGLAYIAQELKRNNHRVEILDINSNRFPKDEVTAHIKNSDPDVIGIGGLVTVYPYLHWLIPEIRRLKGAVPIILGGAIASSLSERCFERFDIDYEVIGEGERTVVELIGALEGGKDHRPVKGIGFREHGKVVFTEKRPLMGSLADVPVIDYSCFPQNELLKNANGVFQIHVQRGCPGACTFCFNCFRVVSNEVRYRPVDNVLEEIETFKNRYDVKLFALTGECVTFNRDWIIGFCKEILKRGLKIRYRVTSRADSIDEEKLEWLRKSGCVVMSLGLETGSEKIIKIIRKGITVQKGREAALLAKKYIPEIEIGIIFGYQGEDENTVRETVRFCKDIGVKPICHYATAFPGTELYRTAVAEGRIKDEESYLRGLDTISIFTPSANLTDMPDDRMPKVLSKAIAEVHSHYFYKDMMQAKFFKRIFRYCAENGLKKTFEKSCGSFRRRR
ncbi:MAG: radical SAM protein [Candidatus Omnitrophica bacterium]|nr:radical SAM protein [Candidatus Omnitrophota bacterium]